MKEILMETTLNWLWQGTVVAGVTGILLRVIGRSRTQTRYWIAWAALLLVLALPGLTVLWSTLPLAGPAIAVEAPARRVPAVVTMPSSLAAAPLVAFAVAGLWCVVHAWRIGEALRALRRVRRASLPFPAALEQRLGWWKRARGTGRQVRLALSAGIRAAAVFGGRDPVIAVSPTLLDGLDDEDLDRVIAHEWAHVQRWDDVAHAVQVLVKGVAGWHPAVWWLDRQLHLEREIACDEAAVAVTGSPKAYAACLARLASLPAASLQPLPVVAALGRSALHRRVARILSRDPGTSVRPAWSVVCLASGLLLAVTAGVGTLRLVALETTEPYTPVASQVLLTRGGQPAPLVGEREPAALVALAAKDAVTHAAGSVAPAISTSLDAIHADGVTSRASRTPAERQAPKAEAVESVASPALAPLAGSNGPMHELFELFPSAVLGPSRNRPTTSEASPASQRGGNDSPWSTAADAGTAIGRRSRDAGIATAGFFTRVGQSIAGSF